MGRQAFSEGVPKDQNPFQRTSNKNGGVFLSAWWESGWTKAKLEKEKSP